MRSNQILEGAWDSTVGIQETQKTRPRLAQSQLFPGKRAVHVAIEWGGLGAC